MLFWVTLLQSVYAYDDIFSKPEYLISKEGFVRRSELKKHITQFDDLGYSHELLTLKNDSYLCVIPRPPLEDRSVYSFLDPTQLDFLDQTPLHPVNKRKTVHNIKTEEVKSIREEAVKLLSSLSRKCLYAPWGWWTCSFCYGKDVSQFHQSDNKNINEEPKPEEGSFVYKLGGFESLMNSDGRDSLSDKDLISEMLKNQRDIKVESNENINYLVYHLGNGTMCELTESERTIEVHFYCAPEAETNSIFWIKELRSCHYQIAINTPQLCQISFFVPPPKIKPLTTNCKIILDNEESVKQYYIENLSEGVEYYDETESPI